MVDQKHVAIHAARAAWRPVFNVLTPSDLTFAMAVSILEDDISFTVHNILWMSLINYHQLTLNDHLLDVPIAHSPTVTCPKGTFCGDIVERCAPESSTFTPDCPAPHPCGTCHPTREYSCVNATTIAFCKNDTPSPWQLANCPSGLFCDVTAPAPSFCTANPQVCLTREKERQRFLTLKTIMLAKLLVNVGEVHTVRTRNRNTTLANDHSCYTNHNSTIDRSPTMYSDSIPRQIPIICLSKLRRVLLHTKYNCLPHQ